MLRFTQTLCNSINFDKRAGRVPFEACVADFVAMYPNDPPDPIRVLQLILLLRAANNLGNGDYVELGTHRGLTLKVIHTFMDPERRLYSFDTFTGFDKRDLVNETDEHHWREGNFLPTSVEQVRRYVGEGKRPANLTIVPGWFPDSFAEYASKVWRFAHVDMDLRTPTATALWHLWPGMVEGGIILVHDYGNMGLGVRSVTDLFCQRVRVPAVEMPDWSGSAVIRKPFR